MQSQSNHSTERYWQVPLKTSPLSQIKKLLSSVSQQQLRRLWRQLLGGGLQATSSNQSFVTLEQLLLWVNNSRSRTFLAFIMELSIFKLAKSAGGNITQWQWPILDSFYLENSTPFFIGRNYLLAYLSPSPFWPTSESTFQCLYRLVFGCGRTTCMAITYMQPPKICENGIERLSLNKVEMGHT